MKNLKLLKRLSWQFARRRFRPIDLATAMLVAGWVPSILLAVISYTILKDTLEREINVDRQTLVKTLATLIGNDLERSGEVMEYYQTLPETLEILKLEPGDWRSQEWLAKIYYSQPRIDGMFLTDADGKLLASVPADQKRIGQEYAPRGRLSKTWKLSPGFNISPVLPRPSDGRMSTFIVVAVRSPNGKIAGYVGASVLVERIGRRLSDFDFGKESVAQVVDQTGFPLFDAEFQPNLQDSDQDELEFYQTLRIDETGLSQHQGNLYTFEIIAGTDWTAVLQQPLTVAYQPVRNLVTKTTLLAAWLVIGTAAAAWLVSQLYRAQLLADERIARETFFNEEILANMPVGVALIHPGDGRFLQTNQSFVSLMREFGGIDPEADFEELEFDDLDLGLSVMYENVLESGEPFQAREKRVKSLDGETRFLTLNLLRLRDTQGLTQGILFVVEDNTEDVSIRRELIAANAAKDQFLALLSHELRNPLSPVITMVAELLQQTEMPELEREALEMIRRNVELEARLIDDLLDITRINHNKLKLNLETVSAHETILRALEISESDIQAKGLAVETELNADHDFVRGDSARLQQVFWNLIKNAVKFTDFGKVRVTSRNEEGEIVVSIEDTGIGIEPARMAKIFKAFEQGERSITRRFGGLGLGLAISQAMIEAHGGTITAHSEGRGKGAAFTVRLKCTRKPAALNASSKVATEPSGAAAKGQILVVDDHVDTCDGMRLLLKRRGYDVVVAHSVAEAVRAARENEIDLLISDLGLPDGNGFDLMREIRSFRQVQGVALSGFGMESDIKKSRAAGFTEHLIKPVNIERLDSILKRLFG